jgi:hypothetical protein
MHCIHVRISLQCSLVKSPYLGRGRRGYDRDRIVVGITATYAISAYHH